MALGHRRPGHLRRVLDGLPDPAPRRRRPASSAAWCSLSMMAGLDDAEVRLDRDRRRGARPPGWNGDRGRRPSLQELARPAAVRQPPSRSRRLPDDRLGNTAAGLAASLRLAATPAPSSRCGTASASWTMPGAGGRRGSRRQVRGQRPAVGSRWPSPAPSWRSSPMPATPRTWNSPTPSPILLLGLARLLSSGGARPTVVSSPSAELEPSCRAQHRDQRPTAGAAADSATGPTARGAAARPSSAGHRHAAAPIATNANAAPTNPA